MTSYAFFDYEKFDDFTEQIQIQLDPLKEHRMEPISIKKNGVIKKQYTEYAINYENKIIKDGYYYLDGNPMNFAFYFERNKFDALSDQSKHIVIVKCPHRVADSLFTEINGFEKKGNFNNPFIKVIPMDVDLKSVATRTTDINGAWFSDLSDQHARSSSVYGFQVDQSRIYQEMEADGTISALYITISDSSGGVYSCIISKNHSITIQNKIPDDASEIELLDLLLHLVFQK